MGEEHTCPKCGKGFVRKSFIKVWCDSCLDREISSEYAKAIREWNEDPGIPDVVYFGTPSGPNWYNELVLDQSWEQDYNPFTDHPENR